MFDREGFIDYVGAKEGIAMYYLLPLVVWANSSDFQKVLVPLRKS